MIIILKKIPANTTERQVEAFVSPVLKGGMFSASGQIENISFWRYEIVQTETFEYYALVDVEPDSVAKRVIKQLDKKAINGKHVALQEYHARHWSNDRRVFKSVIERGSSNKRKADRRRKIIRTERRPALAKNPFDRDEDADSVTISTHTGIWAEPKDINKKK
jgi:hypothetical protein